MLITVIKYNTFWEDPIAASVSWLGLLYSIFCLTIQVQSQQSYLSKAQEAAECLSQSTEMSRILAYREKVVQCLVQAKFAKGGPDIMETLIHYIVIENNLSKDSNIRVWLLMGNIVQIGTSSSGPFALGSTKEGFGSHSHGLPSRPSPLQVLITIPR